MTLRRRVCSHDRLVVFEFFARDAEAQTGLICGFAQQFAQLVASAFAGVVATLFVNEFFFFAYFACLYHVFLLPDIVIGYF